MKKITDWLKINWDILVFLLIVVGLIILAYFVFKDNDDPNPDTSIERRLEALEEGLVLSRTQVEESVGDLEDRIQSLFLHSQEVLDRLNELDLEPDVVTNTVTRVEGQTVTVFVDRFEDIPREFVFRTLDRFVLER